MHKLSRQQSILQLLQAEILTNMDDMTTKLGSAQGTGTEGWHISHFWVSYGRYDMPGLPTGRSEGLSR